MASVKMNESLFRELIAKEKPVLVDFWAPWCTYCRRIDPVYERLADQYGEELVVAKVNIDEEPALAQAERIEVIPTLVLYRAGKALGDMVAPGSKAEIEAFVDRLM